MIAMCVIVFKSGDEESKKKAIDLYDIVESAPIVLVENSPGCEFNRYHGECRMDCKNLEHAQSFFDDLADLISDAFDNT